MAIDVDIFEEPVFRRSSWICAVSRPGSEFVAAANLELEDIETYIPVCKYPKSGIMRRTALFPGYFFVKLCEKIPKLRKVTEITGFICLNNEPILVQQKVIDALRNREIDGIIPLNQAPPPKLGFVAGLPIRLTQGAHSGLSGTFERLLGHNRASIRLPAFGGSVRVSVPLEAFVSQAEHRSISSRAGR